MADEGTRRVYSTDGEHAVSSKSARPQRGRPGRATGGARPFPDDGFVRIRRETSGRGGKTVTAVYGLPGSDADLDALLKTLKQRCGSGGTRVGSTIELQGDHRERVRAALDGLGYRVKMAGG